MHAAGKLKLKGHTSLPRYFASTASATNHKLRRGTSNDLGAQPHLATRNEVGLVAHGLRAATYLPLRGLRPTALRLPERSAARAREIQHRESTTLLAGAARPHCGRVRRSRGAHLDEPQKRLDYMRIAKSGSTSLKLLLLDAIKSNAACKPLRLHFHDHKQAFVPGGKDGRSRSCSDPLFRNPGKLSNEVKTR